MRLGKPKPVAEYEAKGEIERVYHEIRQVLRINGMNLNFPTWAGYGQFLPVMWDAIRANLETRIFESAAARSVLKASELRVSWGNSRFQADCPSKGVRATKYKKRSLCITTPIPSCSC